MKEIILFFVCILLAGNASAQTENFDIASFVPPKGWQRLDSNGKLGFFSAKTMNGATHFCQILLFPSRVSSGDALKDFNEDWQERIVKATGYTESPKTAREKSAGGWDVVTGYANITQGVTYTCTLTTLSGYGKEMSVLVNIAGQDYLPEVNVFFKNLVLNRTTSSNSQTSMTSTSLDNYIYTAPPGWTSTQYPDGIVLSAPVSNTGEKCSITLWPMRASTGDLQNEAGNLFSQVFNAFEPRSSSTPGSMIKGTSAGGWDYFMVKRSIGLRGGDYQTMFGFVFVARLGDQLASISGISKDPLVSSCFGLQLTDVWPHFFYSLGFKNWTSGADNPLAERIPGVWMAVTASAGDRFAFASNGRYAGTAAAQRYVRLSGTELLRTTDAYFGDGSYSISGNTIALTQDKETSPSSGWLRIEAESRDEGRTWVEKLYLLRKSAVDGSEYEVAYEKQN